MLEAFKNYEFAESDRMVSISHPGAVRIENEDAVTGWHYPQHNLRVAVLADGMGGHAGGALASQLALRTIKDELDRCVGLNAGVDPSFDVALIDAVIAANQAILNERQSQPEYEHMGTTLVLLAIQGDELRLINIGDSRCYRFDMSDAQIECELLTHDDSVVQAMLDEGVITEADVPNVPYRNKLTRALGVDAQLSVTVRTIQLGKHDVLMLCSDGFYHAVNLNAAGELIQNQGVSLATAQQLIDESLANHTDDNTSLLLVGSGSE